MTEPAKWHRTEPREVRPFFESVSAETALNGCGIRLYEDGDVSTETSFELDEIDFKRLAPAVSLSVPKPEGWLGETLKPDDLELVVLVRHGFLKRSHVVRSLPMSAPVPALIDIGSEALALVGGGRNTQITIAICLADDRPPRPGVPFVTGHWLSKKTFTVRSRTMPTLFDLRTRTDEDWLAAGFPPKTYYAVDYLGGIDAELEEGASVATVWVHADAHAKLATSSLGDAMQPLLASEIISIILTESFNDWKEQPEVSAESALANLLEKLGGDEPMQLSALKTLVSKPTLLRATLQDRLSVISALR